MRAVYIKKQIIFIFIDVNDLKLYKLEIPTVFTFQYNLFVLSTNLTLSYACMFVFLLQTKGKSINANKLVHMFKSS